MRITNSMIRNDVLWSINKNETLMKDYEMQLSTGKKIQRPSDDPIVAVRALKFRTNLREIEQYKTNNEDAKSWLSVTEQAMRNTMDLLQRGRELSVQASSDVLSTDDRANVAAELNQIQAQMFNEANVNYAGRYVFSGFQTDEPVSLNTDNSDIFDITETVTSDNMSMKQVVDGENVVTVPRYRLGYSEVNVPPTWAGTPVLPAFTSTDTISGMTVVETDTLGSNINIDPATSEPYYSPYQPPAGTVFMLKDTGELVFNQQDYETGVIPDPFTVDYEKNTFNKNELNPKLFFNSTDRATGISYTPPTDTMDYQVSYNQDITVNTNAHDVFTVDLYRDLEEIIQGIDKIPDDGSIEQSLQEDILGDVFKEMLGKFDTHIHTIVDEQAAVGSKVNRLDLTIKRLEDDEINFTELKSMNEDVDMTEALLNLRSQELIYNASLQASTTVMQKTLMDFLR